MEESINLQEIVDSLKNRWKFVIICMLSFILVASIMTFFVIKPTYQSSTKVFIGKEETKVQTYDQSEITMYQKLIKTFSETLKTKDLIKGSLAEINSDKNVNYVLSNLTVVPVADTQIIEIKYQDKSSFDAATVLNSIKNEFVTLANELVPNVNIKVIEDVREYENPISPNKTMNIAIAAILGLMVGVGAVFLLEFMDSTFKTKEQLENSYDIPVIGVIPSYTKGEIE
ncbi:MAG: Wzz/FepE/Etk N-terminal domain-containing protein [Clostridium sp.]